MIDKCNLQEISMLVIIMAHLVELLTTSLIHWLRDLFLHATLDRDFILVAETYPYVMKEKQL